MKGTEDAEEIDKHIQLKLCEYFLYIQQNLTEKWWIAGSNDSDEYLAT